MLSTVLRLLYIIFILIFILVIPGFLISLRFIKKFEDGVELFAVSLGCGVVIITTLSIITALFFNKLISLHMLLVISPLTTFFALFIGRGSLGAIISLIKTKILRKKCWVLLLFVLVSLLFFVRYDFTASGGWTDGCLNHATDKLIGAHENIIVDGRIYGDRMPHLFPTSEKVLENLYKNNKSIIEDQRLGSPAFISIFAVLFHFLGFRVLYAILILLIVSFSYLQFRLLFKKEALSICGAVFVVLNPFVLSFPFVIEGLIALFLLAFGVYSMMKYDSKLLAGLIFGLLYGVRDIAILFLPAMLFWIGIKNYKKVLIFIIGFLIAAAPYFYWHWFAFGSFFVTESMTENLLVQHNILGLPFNYPGLLNFPFYEKIVRTPFIPYPVFLLIPLFLTAHFGLIFIAISIVGISSFYRQNKKVLVFSLILLIPFMLFLSAQENWIEDAKLSYLLLPVSLLMLYPIAFFNEVSQRKHQKKLIVASLVALIGLFLFLTYAKSLDFPNDPRIYYNHPDLETEIKAIINYEKEVYAGISLLPSYSLANKHSNLIREGQFHELLLDLANRDYDLQYMNNKEPFGTKKIYLDFSKDILRDDSFVSDKEMSNSYFVEFYEHQEVLLRNISFDFIETVYDIQVTKESSGIKIYINPYEEDINPNITEIEIDSNKISFYAPEISYLKVYYTPVRDLKRFSYNIYQKNKKIIVDGPKREFLISPFNWERPIK